MALVNQTLAARLGDDVVGQPIRVGDERTPRRIVGVVPDLKYNAITERPQPFLSATRAGLPARYGHSHPDNS